MTRRVPILPTVIVLAAVATMIALGFWQLDRRSEKAALLASYEQASGTSSEVPWPRTPEDYPAALYRRARIDCVEVIAIDAVAGRSLVGQTGWAQIARCAIPGGGIAPIALGWSSRPSAPQWTGGVVGGVIGPAGKEVRLVAMPAVGGLAQLANPDPKALPNNHLSYAVQWFLFAVTALIIYALALRRRGSE